MATYGSRLLQVGDTGSDVIELQIRLAGFKNASIPSGIFSTKTKSQVISFQKNYMKITPSGIVDLQTYDATDDFADEFNFDTLFGNNNWTTKGKFRCPCNDLPDIGCQVPNLGFGHNDNTDVFRPGKSKIEAYHSKEYLGIHRMLLWAARAVLFYHPQYTWTINSGYRCRNDNTLRGRKSTNHMGKAVDLDPGGTTQCDDARRRIVQKMAAQIAWNGTNKKALEPSNIAPTWVHFDVRTFSPQYLSSDFFATNEITLNNKVTHTLTENSEEVAEEPLFEAQEEIIIKQNTRQHDVTPKQVSGPSTFDCFNRESKPTSSKAAVDKIIDEAYDDLSSGIYDYVTNTNNFQLKAITTGTCITPAGVPTPLTDFLKVIVYFNSESQLKSNLKSVTFTGLPSGGMRNLFVGLNTWLNTPVRTIGLAPDAANAGTVLIDAIVPPDNGVTGLHGTIIFPTVINMGIACENELNNTSFPTDPKENRIKTWEIINKYIKMAININVIAPIPTVGTCPTPNTYTGVTNVTLVWTDEQDPETGTPDGLGTAAAAITLGTALLVVPDYTLVFNTLTNVFARSLPDIANPLGLATIPNSLGNLINSDSLTNGNLILSADDALLDEESFPISNQVGSDEEEEDFTGAEGLNQLVTSMIDFGSFMADNVDDVGTALNGDIIDMQIKMVLVVKAPIVKTVFNPATKTAPDGVVTR